MSYPVLEISDDVRQKLAAGGTVIVQAPPGAGKSTVLPLQLLEEPWLERKKIVMLEPRRLAARSVAMRMASILQTEVGGTVGYRVRFDNKVGPSTQIEVVTEGILTRMLQQDNALASVGLVIFDEFHERSLHADLSLALCLQIQQVLRPDLRILIMSATLDAEKISSRLNNAPVITSLGKQYPVSIHYVPSEAHTSVVNHTLGGIRKALRDQAGDVLVFLPGAGEIKRVAELLKEIPYDAEVLPLYGDLPYKKQQEALLPHPQGKRKIILATSIAETSLTIEGIGVVVDSGMARVPKFNPRSGFTRLETVRVTKDSADQRAGRAGRLGPGNCYRMWSEREQANLIPQRIPEIEEADLTPMMLEVLAWGIKDVNELTWISPPPRGAVSQALDVLKNLKALDDNRITSIGRAMVRLPIHPRLGHMMLEASVINQNAGVALATDLAALLEERDPLSKQSGADLGLRIDALRSWRKGNSTNADPMSLDRIEKLASSWRKLMKVEVDNTRVDETITGSLLMAAFPERLAKRVDVGQARYKLANGRSARLPDHDPLVSSQWLAIGDLDEGYGEGKIFLAAPVSTETLIENSDTREVVRWDDTRGVVVSNTERHIGDLVISTSPRSQYSQEVKNEVLCQVIQKNGLQMLGWEESHKQWQARVMSIARWRPNESWPDVSNEKLLETIHEWLTPFLGGITKATELLKLDLQVILDSIIPYVLSVKLDLLAPMKLPVPSGSLIKLVYFENGQNPVMEVRLQEVFGLAETPAVNEGRTKIILHLLSPGYKPVQVTQDLKSFWANAYNDVRKELRSRYPKHSWPEDPWTAQAVRGAKRRT